jgi:hypothetical protein
MRTPTPASPIILDETTDGTQGPTSASSASASTADPSNANTSSIALHDNADAAGSNHSEPTSSTTAATQQPIILDEKTLKTLASETKALKSLHSSLFSALAKLISEDEFDLAEATNNRKAVWTRLNADVTLAQRKQLDSWNATIAVLFDYDLAFARSMAHLAPFLRFSPKSLQDLLRKNPVLAGTLDNAAFSVDAAIGLVDKNQAKNIAAARDMFSSWFGCYSGILLLLRQTELVDALKPLLFEMDPLNKAAMAVTTYGEASSALSDAMQRRSATLSSLKNSLKKEAKAAAQIPDLHASLEALHTWHSLLEQVCGFVSEDHAWTDFAPLAAALKTAASDARVKGNDVVHHAVEGAGKVTTLYKKWTEQQSVIAVWAGLRAQADAAQDAFAAWRAEQGEQVVDKCFTTMQSFITSFAEGGSASGTTDGEAAESQGRMTEMDAKLSINPTQLLQMRKELEAYEKSVLEYAKRKKQIDSQEQHAEKEFERADKARTAAAAIEAELPSAIAALEPLLSSLAAQHEALASVENVLEDELRGAYARDVDNLMLKLDLGDVDGASRIDTVLGHAIAAVSLRLSKSPSGLGRAFDDAVSAVKSLEKLRKSNEAVKASVYASNSAAPKETGKEKEKEKEKDKKVAEEKEVVEKDKDDDLNWRGRWKDIADELSSTCEAARSDWTEMWRAAERVLETHAQGWSTATEQSRNNASGSVGNRVIRDFQEDSDDEHPAL